MLVLTRKADESVLIGNDICITVLGIEGDRVRIGIDAPRALRIYRSELVQETKDANLDAAKAPLVKALFKK